MNGLGFARHVSSDLCFGIVCHDADEYRRFGDPGLPATNFGNLGAFGRIAYDDQRDGLPVDRSGRAVGGFDDGVERGIADRFVRVVAVTAVLKQNVQSGIHESTSMSRKTRIKHYIRSVPCGNDMVGDGVT